MYYLRNIVTVALLVCCWGVFGLGRVGPKKELVNPTYFAVSQQKTFIVTYRVDEGNKRGKEQKKTVVANSSSEAKESVKTEIPNAVIISCTEK
jgi:hypothetical protein